MPLSTVKISRLIACSRPAFLLLPLSSLSLAMAYVISQNISINLLHLGLIFLAALSAHASVNLFNDYQDFKSGLDFHTQRTPFSGGSGTLPNAPELAESVLTAAIICLLITALIGCYFLWAVGWELLLVGVPGLLLIYFYTQKITRSPFLCLIAPGLGFGLLMINGAYFGLSGHYSIAMTLNSVIVFFLVNNLLLLNQFPDLEADKRVGRYHLPILIGRKKSAWVYSGFLVAAYTALLLSIFLGFLPYHSLLGLLSLFWAIPAARISLQYPDDLEKLIPALGLNVAVTLTTPVLIAAGIMWQYFLD